MKKTLSFLLSSVVCCAMYAQSGEDGTAKPDTTGQDVSKKIIATFYGSESSTDPRNPCKGATVRVCARIEAELTGQSQTTDSLKGTDANGKLLSEARQLLAKSLEEARKGLETVRLEGTAQKDTIK